MNGQTYEQTDKVICIEGYTGYIRIYIVKWKYHVQNNFIYEKTQSQVILQPQAILECR